MAKVSQTHWQQLSGTVEKGMALSEQLISVLESEQEALIQRDFETLQQLIDSKQIIINQINDQLENRLKLLADLGIDSEKTVLELARQEYPAFNDIWENAASAWQACQNQNAVNEKIAARSNQVVSRLLDVLNGHTGGQLYTQSGKAIQNPKTNTIANA